MKLEWNSPTWWTNSHTVLGRERAQTSKGNIHRLTPPQKKEGDGVEGGGRKRKSYFFCRTQKGRQTQPNVMASHCDYARVREWILSH